MSALTPSQARALFPALPRLAYLNAAASSPLCRPVLAAGMTHLAEQAEQGDLGFSAWLTERERVRADVAAFLHAAQPNEIAFTPSTSFGIHVIGRLLWQLGVREVWTPEQEVPTTPLPLLHLGFKLRVVRPQSDGGYPVEALEAALGTNTGAIIGSAVQYASGARLDLPGTAALCKTKKLLFAVNAAQAFGQIPLDVSVGVDLLAATSHKWAMAGYGCGLFYARASLFESLQLPVAGWLSVESAMNMDNLVGARVEGRGSSVFTAEGAAFRRDVTAVEMGVGSHLPIRSLGAALTVLKQVGVEQIAAHNFQLQHSLRAELTRRGFQPNAACEPNRGSGICVIPVRGDPLETARALATRDVV
ncbi:MAG: aminotransferase class V-fold PLP-dependent enzyme, partial [Myxococcaceae bacterium]